MNQEKQTLEALIRSMQLVEIPVENEETKSSDNEDDPGLGPKCPSFP